MRIIGADIRHAQPVHQELGQLVDARDNHLHLHRQPTVARQLCRAGIHVAHHADARGRRRDHDVGVGKDVYEMTHERQRLALIARVVVHLATTGLRLGEVHRVPQALEDGDGRLPDLGKERVVETGDEERDSHRPGHLPLLAGTARRYQRRAFSVQSLRRWSADSSLVSASSVCTQRWYVEASVTTGQSLPKSTRSGPKTASVWATYGARSAGCQCCQSASVASPLTLQATLANAARASSRSRQGSSCCASIGGLPTGSTPQAASAPVPTTP